MDVRLAVIDRRRRLAFRGSARRGWLRSTLANRFCARGFRGHCTAWHGNTFPNCWNKLAIVSDNEVIGFWTFSHYLPLSCPVAAEDLPLALLWDAGCFAPLGIGIETCVVVISVLLPSAPVGLILARLSALLMTRISNAICVQEVSLCIPFRKFLPLVIGG